MIRAVAAAAALVVFMVPLLATPTLSIAVPGGFALILAMAGIVASWRWPVTAAACVFVIDYAAAVTGQRHDATMPAMARILSLIHI